MRNYLFSAFLITAFFSCKKESEKKYCWQGFSPSGGIVQGLLLCDKTAAEAKAAYPQYWFFKSDEPIYCWLSQPVQSALSYMQHVPASMIDSFKVYGGGTFIRIDCNSFCKWQWHEKVRSKITGLYGYTKVGTEVFTTDSCSKLFVGKTVTVRETTDSIFTREFKEQYK